MKRLLFFVVVVLVATMFARPAESAARKVVLEMFTSTTCSPCYAADNFYFNQWLPNYGGASSVITIAYHVWWPSPGNDPMYLHNTGPVQTRNTYYQPTGGFAPRAFIDGFIDGGSGYSSWPGTIEGRFLDSSPITITLTGTRNGSQLNVNAAIFAEAAVNSSNWRVHWFMLEDGISQPQNSPSGYVPFIHHAVHRAMYPDGNGSTIAITQGQTVNIPRQITMNAAWIPENCKIVVLVQDNTNKKIQNAQVIEIRDLTTVSVGEPGGDIPGQFALAQNYPNPFNPATNFKFQIPSTDHVTLKVFDLLGQEVATLVNEVKSAGTYTVQWDASNLPSGMYIYRLQAGNSVESKKMVLAK